MTGNQAQKRDAGKPMWRLFPFRAARAIVRVLEFGLWKYGAEGGWKSVDDGEKRYLDALLRHAEDVQERGISALDICEHHDGDRPAECRECSGLPVLAHLACDALFLLWYAFKGQDLGRPWEKQKKVDVPYFTSCHAPSRRGELCIRVRGHDGFHQAGFGAGSHSWMAAVPREQFKQE